MRLRNVVSALLLAGFCFSASVGHAANLVTNGGFENGNFSGWTQGTNISYTGITHTNVHSGTYAAFLGPFGSDGSLSQNIATLANENYQVSFYLASEGGTPNHFTLSVNMGGTVLFSQSNIPSSPYTLHTFNYTSSTVGDVLSINFRNDPHYLYLDDVMVNDLGPSTTPEPGSMAMIATGALSSLGLAFKKRIRR